MGRPRPRIVQPRAGLEKLAREGRCRLCGHRGVPLERHHLVPRSRGGDDVDENLVPLCGTCHRAISAYSRVVRPALGRQLHYEERAYIVRRIGEQGENGWAWLDRNYPATRPGADGVG